MNLNKMEHYFESQKDYYEAKAQRIKDLGDKATSEDIEMKAFYYGKVAAFGEVITMVKLMMEEAE